MANQWFKFYGPEYLSDPKVLSLSGDERSCWVTLLALACQTKDGIIRFLSEDQLLVSSGVREKIPVYEKFEQMQMISRSNGDVTVLNWEKRQLSEAIFRVREYRKRESNANVTTEKNRVEENRKEIHRSVEYLRKIPESDLQEFSTTYLASKSQIKTKAEDLALYCGAKGKKYSNYRMFLLGALRKDFQKRPPQEIKPKVPFVESGRGIPQNMKEALAAAAKGIKS